MTRNFFKKFALVFFLINTLTACTALQATPAPNSPIRVEFTQWWGDYTLLVAKEKGYFEKYGLEVEPVYYDVFSDSYPDLVAGQIDGALITVGDAINTNSNSPMKVVAIQDNGGNDAIVVGPEINSIQNLNGKTIGMTIGSQYEMNIFNMLQSANMSVEDVNIISMNPEDALSALESGRVQAAYTWEPYLSDTLSNDYKIIYPREQEQEQLRIPNQIVFRKSLVDERPEDVRAFLKAWFEALEYRMQNESETRKIAAKYLGISPDDVKPDDALKLYTADENKILFDIKEANSIYSITKATSDYLISTGVLIENTDLLELLDPSYLP